MTRPGRRCDHCGRPIGRRPGILSWENIFCSPACRRRFPVALRRRMIAHYRQMADDAGGWIAETLAWNQLHPDETPIDIEALRLVKGGALEVVDALEQWAPVPERALRMINSALFNARQDPRQDADI